MMRGVTFDNGASDYSYHIDLGAATSIDEAQAELRIATTVGSASTEFAFGEFKIVNGRYTDRNTAVFSEMGRKNTTAESRANVLKGKRNSAIITNGLQLKSSSGDFDIIRISTYGILL